MAVREVLFTMDTKGLGVITTGASVVTSRGSLPQCMEVLTVILYKIRELGLWVVFLHLAMRDREKRLDVAMPRPERNRVVLGESNLQPPRLF